MSSVRPGREDAAMAWQRVAEVQQARPGRQRLLGLLQAGVAAAIGLVLRHFGHTTVAAVVLSVAALIGVAALVSPVGLYAGIQRGFAQLGRISGLAVTWILMVPLFYLFFLPFGLLFRRGRRDRLQRFFDEDAESYWESLEEESSSLERQF